MKIDWRVSAIAAGSAFLLSVLVGVLGNVAFGVLILRAVVAAAVFGAGAIGVTILIDRFIPELRRAPVASTDSTVGGAVDIVVEGDDDVRDDDVRDDDVRDDDVTGVAEESVEQDGELSGQRALADDDMSSEAGDGVLEEVEEADDGPVPVGLASGTESVEDISVADDLPRVDPIPGGFSEVPLGDSGVDDSPASGEDPELMARAIRTVLKREE